MQHTPGPWTAHSSHIYAPDGEIIATVSNPGSKESDYPLIANRDLMAAAPDLIEAIEFVLCEGMLGAHSAHWDKQGTHGLNCLACQANKNASERLRAALAKAKESARGS